MALKETVFGDVVVLTPTGNLLGDDETDQLRDRIKSLVGENFIKVVLDVSSLQWVNSAGLGAMISCLASLTNKGGELRIANITDKLQSLFLITQLIKVFKTYESVDRAVASFLIDPVPGAPAA
jgi:anti-sigma B factor antagonist